MVVGEFVKDKIEKMNGLGSVIEGTRSEQRVMSSFVFFSLLNGLAL